MDLRRAARRNPYAARLTREGHTVRVTRGRPRKGEESGPTLTKSVRLSPEMWALLEDRARKLDVPLHALLREAILALLSRDRVA
jgi:hypothetical protein